ncbi:MAG: amino acid racemase [Alphaproteobacteria bacterium]|nr:amino acid racemase [Alphaproteobacteria bacterium]MBL6946475.1 amino acid racemase [Rhodospirillales bacterium]
MKKPTLGILGGMGPLATLDFMHKVIELTPAASDQDHLPMVLVSVPHVPDRTAAIVGEGESPLPVLLDGIATLNKAGVDCVAVPCNSAHFWFDELAGASNAPIVHIADAAIAALDVGRAKTRRIGFLGTSGSVQAGIYEKRLIASGFECVNPTPEDQENLIMQGIYQIKAGNLDQAGTLLDKAAANLRARGVEAIILGCTEIPIVVDEGDGVVDATRALAQACVTHLLANSRLAVA